MFNDNIIRRPINSTAAIVSSQSGCSDSLTATQERDQKVDRLNQLKLHLLTLKKKSKLAKSVGVEIFNLCSEISELNKKIKKLNIKESERLDFHNCFFRVVRQQTTKLQYERFIKLAHEMLSNNKD